MTTFKIENASGEFASLHIEHLGRTHIYTGATARMLVAVMNEHAANHIVKMQQAMNDALGEDLDGEERMYTVREHVATYATNLRKGDL